MLERVAEAKKTRDRSSLGATPPLRTPSAVTIPLMSCPSTDKGSRAAEMLNTSLAGWKFDKWVLLNWPRTWHGRNGLLSAMPRYRTDCAREA